MKVVTPPFEEVTMRLILTASLFALAAPAICQTTATVPKTLVSQEDSWEGYNRWMFNLNLKVDRVTLKPAAKAYKSIAPQFFQRGFSNAISNTKEPWTFINAVLQGKGDPAFRTLGRFLINTTVGLGGIFNVAGKWGVQHYDEDLGQTLAVWGVPSGPYFMLPGFGPSNPRDAFGRLIKIIYEPVNLVIGKEVGKFAGYGQTAAEFFDTRVSLMGPAEIAMEQSDDPYVTVRSAWYQNRIYKILDGNVPAPSGGDLFDEEGEQPAPPAEAETPTAAPQASNDVRSTGDLCVAQNCSPAELDAAMDAARSGMSSEVAVAKALDHPGRF
jgi:phospholipid-binding lipoprotein MlaA